MMHEGFSRQATKVGDVHVAVLRGELDLDTAEGLSDWLVEMASSPVVVDMSELSFMDSSGITALVIAKNRLAANGDDLILARPHPFVKRVLETVGMADWVTDWDPKWDAV